MSRLPEPKPYGTGREHLAWCVQRAMEYANQGDMATAWASFGSDALKHPATRHIPGDLLYGMAMVSQVYRTPRDLEHFLSGWSVADTPYERDGAG